MSKTPLTIQQLLDSIEEAHGRAARETARRLFDLGTDCEAYLWPRHQSASIRLVGSYSPGQRQKWLTLFVVSAAGTVYTNWLERWAWAGIPPSAASRYRNGLERVFDDRFVRHPSTYASGVPLSEIRRNWVEFDGLVRRAATRIHSASTEHGRSNGKVGTPAMEGLETEGKMLRRSRNRRLKLEVLARANGVCAACDVNYTGVLGGSGLRALQVHHLDQLAVNDTPQLTTADRLAVVCANCHAMIHADRIFALPVHSLRARWRRFRRRSAART
jgi:hypothetical protein